MKSLSEKGKSLSKWALAGAFLTVASASTQAKELFSEDFNSQPDWTSAMHSSTNSALLPWEGDVLPDDWYAGRQDPTWAPSKGHDDRHEAVEILSTNTGVMTVDGTGKSFVAWRDSYDPDGSGKRWNSDGMLLKYFPEGHDDLYVEFWINFSNESVATYYANGFGISKIFRIYNWGGDESQFFSYFGDENSPKFLWDIGGSTTYGIRNIMSMYARGPNFSNNEIPSLPRSFVNGGDLSLSYATDTGGMEEDGSDPQLENKKDGGIITDWPVHLDQLMGDETVWTKMAFYVKMNSAPGVADGVVMQWVDGHRILFNDQIPWIQEGYSMVPWNIVSIGGNDNFAHYDNADRHEEWYAIDNIKVYDGIPNTPLPPENVIKVVQ